MLSLIHILTVALAYYKALDDWKDEKKAGKRWYGDRLDVYKRQLQFSFVAYTAYDVQPVAEIEK